MLPEKCPFCESPVVESRPLLIFECGCEFFHEWKRGLRCYQGQIALLKKVLPDSEKLDLLASWIDAQYPDVPNVEVQNDLREWARTIRKLNI